VQEARLAHGGVPDHDEAELVDPDGLHRSRAPPAPGPPHPPSLGQVGRRELSVQHLSGACPPASSIFLSLQPPPGPRPLGKERRGLEGRGLDLGGRGRGRGAETGKLAVGTRSPAPNSCKSLHLNADWTPTGKWVRLRDVTAELTNENEGRARLRKGQPMKSESHSSTSVWAGLSDQDSDFVGLRGCNLLVLLLHL
jgi:hypothetical protein